MDSPLENTTTSIEEHYWTVGFFDKGVYQYSGEIDNSHSMEYVLEWQFDLENSTGFLHAEKRNSTQNRVPMFTLEPGTTGKITIELEAPKENDLTIFLSPETDLPGGVTLALENTSITIPAGQTVTASMYLTMQANVTKNDGNVSCIWLETTHGMKTGRWCLILTSYDSQIPDVD